MRAGWNSDPVHPNGHIYANMALNLIEKVVPAISAVATAAADGDDSYKRGGLGGGGSFAGSSHARGDRNRWNSYSSYMDSANVVNDNYISIAIWFLLNIV
jgi:hypothetical protein